MRVMEVDDFDAIAGCPWLSFWTEDTAPQAINAMAAARAGRSERFEGFCPTMKGSPRWWVVVVSPILGEDGRPEQLLSISRDITERRAAEEHQLLLLREMQHRVKNTLAMAQAVAVQTMRHAVDLPSAREALDGRLAALGEAHDLLVRDNWQSSRIDEVARKALGPYYDGQRISMSGPPVRVSGRAALAIAMALNELATNATKYGALSNEAGLVSLSWSLTEDASLDLAWRESGGPPVTAPTQRGFGSLLIERSLAGQFRGSSVVSFPADGAQWAFTAPLAELQARG